MPPRRLQYHGPCNEIGCKHRPCGPHYWCRNHHKNRSRGRRPQHIAKTGRPPKGRGVPKYRGKSETAIRRRLTPRRKKA